ncbi:hypothetical protein LLEC1_02869 [Akanthomyces lecanii]|uniref:Uncharacterized protein n=1 Tax=Cordyceps confragosa TaxID=2714763 RepID=A0A179I3X0_CORDF|nr:hypothetical protein LLEC1_02869 [Akanthomyces lecanii]
MAWRKGREGKEHTQVNLRLLVVPATVGARGVKKVGRSDGIDAKVVTAIREAAECRLSAVARTHKSQVHKTKWTQGQDEDRGHIQSSRKKKRKKKEPRQQPTHPVPLVSCPKAVVDAHHRVVVALARLVEAVRRKHGHVAVWPARRAVVRVRPSAGAREARAAGPPDRRGGGGQEARVTCCRCKLHGGARAWLRPDLLGRGSS